MQETPGCKHHDYHDGYDDHDSDDYDDHDSDDYDSDDAGDYDSWHLF